MAEEKKEKWLNYLSLTTILIAVCATLSTFKGGGYSTKSMLNQSRASDQWSFYQAKSIKADLYENQKVMLELEKNNTALTVNKEDVLKQISVCEDKIKKYADDKAKIKKDAEDYEGQRENVGVVSLACVKASKILEASSLVMPMPLSRTLTESK